MRNLNKKMIFPTAVSLALFCAVPAFAGNWKQETSGQRVYMQDVTNKAVNRFLTIDGKKYYVDADGVRVENRWFSQTSVPNNPQQKVCTTWYYAGVNGAIYTDGWYKIGDSYYYFYAGGNSPRGTFLTLDGKKYYVDADGVRQQNGWFSISGVAANGNTWTNWYYALPDGTMYVGGWVPMNGKQYYFDAGGRSPRSTWVNIENDRYYVDADGAMKTGWFSISGVGANGTEWTNWYCAHLKGRRV